MITSFYSNHIIESNIYCTLRATGDEGRRGVEVSGGEQMAAVDRGWWRRRADGSGGQQMGAEDGGWERGGWNEYARGRGSQRTTAACAGCERVVADRNKELKNIPSVKSDLICTETLSSARADESVSAQIRLHFTPGIFFHSLFPSATTR